MAIFFRCIQPLAPALISFGPLFIAMGVPGPFHRTSVYGALATSLGILILLLKIQWLERRIEQLSGKGGDPKP